ncbi:MAG TPA: hypothetical protein ENK57_03075 [Polyangiaceae bacterium]|nr:hypothetical protein [Polyangiaceae bacterium]
MRSLRKLAGALGLAPTTIRRYAARGLTVPAPSGGWDVEATRTAIEQARASDTVGTASLKRGESPDILRLRARLLEERARLLELDRREREGELVPIEEVRRFVGGEIVAARTKILAAPQRLRQRFPELPMAAIEHLDAILREALEELSEQDPEMGESGARVAHDRPSPAGETIG